MTEVKRIDIAEFRALGFLQEANRLFFHPLGLGLEAVAEKCPVCLGGGEEMIKGEDRRAKGVPCERCHGSGQAERLGGVWDYRQDAEGIYYDFAEATWSPYVVDAGAKADYVAAEMLRHAPAREALFGDGVVVEPLPAEDQADQPQSKESSK